MIVRAAVPKPELQHVSGQGPDDADGVVEAGTLRLHSSDERIESAHGAGTPWIFANRTTTWCAAVYPATVLDHNLPRLTGQQRRPDRDCLCRSSLILKRCGAQPLEFRCHQWPD